MFSIICRNGNIKKIFHPNDFVPSMQHNLPKQKFMFPLYASHFEKYMLTVRHHGYSRSVQVSEEYNQRYEQRLKELLQKPEKLNLYNKIKLELQYEEHLSDKIPETIKAYDWLVLLSSQTKKQRRTYLQFMWLNEKKTENFLRKKQMKRIEREEEIRDDNSDHLKYGLHFNTFFLRVYDTTIMRHYNNMLMKAMLFEPTVVFDLGYSKYMSIQECHNCAKQLAYAFAINRLHDNPFNLQFCNAYPDDLLMHKVHRQLPTMYDEDFPLNITEKSYTEIYDRDKLVYLSPHAKDTLRNYDPNMIYIIGAMVDKKNPKPLSLAKAREEKIRLVKYPLTHYLDWGLGSGKNLPLNQVLSILLDLKQTRSWEVALKKNVPMRKLKEKRCEYLKNKMKRRNKIIELLSSE